jgi:hypothetical protein
VKIEPGVLRARQWPRYPVGYQTALPDRKKMMRLLAVDMPMDQTSLPDIFVRPWSRKKLMKFQSMAGFSRTRHWHVVCEPWTHERECP